jgi:hypothetical protein
MKPGRSSLVGFALLVLAAGLAQCGRGAFPASPAPTTNSGSSRPSGLAPTLATLSPASDPSSFAPPAVPPPVATKPKPAATTCPANALLGVYHSYRLHVLGTCRWYSGTVERILHEGDGDTHVDIAPASGMARFLDQDNYSAQHGQLVNEIMPGQHFPILFVGEAVQVLGTWVYDADHGWNEMHPIWDLKIAGATYRSLPPATPLYKGSDDSGGSGGGSGGGGGGTNCDPNYLVTGGPCLQDGIGDYDCYGGSGNGPNYTPQGATIKVVGADVFGLDGNHDGYGCN